MSEAASGSPFWRFSLAFYRRAGVADACIALQEEAGVDVNLLLFLLWQATRKRVLSAAEIGDLERRIAHDLRYTEGFPEHRPIGQTGRISDHRVV